MKPTLSTAAFDALVVAQPDRCLWTARGFVSDEVCGFALFVSARGGVPLDFPSATRRWWDSGALKDGFPMELCADGVPLTLELEAEGYLTQGAGPPYIAVVFAPPQDCAGLRLTVRTDIWAIEETVALDPEEMRASLAQWAQL